MFSWGDQLLPPATVNLLRPTNRIGCLAAENHPHTTVTSIKDGGNTFLQSNKATLDIKKKVRWAHVSHNARNEKYHHSEIKDQIL